MDKAHEFACVSYELARLYIVLVYRSPAGNFENFLLALEKLIAELTRVNPSFEVVIGGDFNVDLLKADNRAKDFINLLRSLDMYLANWRPTRLDACLDNVASTLRIDDCIRCSPLNLFLSDHLALECTVEVSSLVSEPVRHQRHVWVRPIIQCGQQRFLQLLDNINWDLLLVHPCAELNFTSFFNEFLCIFNGCFPLKRILQGQSKRHGVAWVTDGLLDLRDLMLVAYEKFRADRLPSSRRIYSGLKKSYQQAVRMARLQFNSALIDRSPNKCKAAWSIIRASTGSSVPSTIPVSADDLHDTWTDSIHRIRGGIQASSSVAVDLLAASVRPPDSQLLTWRPVTCEDVLWIVTSLSKSSKHCPVWPHTLGWSRRCFTSVTHSEEGPEDPLWC
ncbi:uncharacterized protein LOC120349982 [Nilaparvata lugens]|uniref:uncharacterized protein LOC120349982 n=1 Tax=Nilaparvata lugens TaxID=108931 RepID=UPI00193EA8B3|nr:uncharacterized protein LOC120349982 [Nilaparvata lugens]